jgi:hypothetical protein
MATAPQHPAVRDRLIDAIAEVEFPAERWQVIACAATRRADPVTCSRLARLPGRTYADLAEVLAAALPTRTVTDAARPEDDAPGASFRRIRAHRRSSTG